MTTSHRNQYSVANSQFTDVGNVGAGEDTLQTFSLPANTLNANGKAVRVRAWFRTAANVNLKTIRLRFGATAVATAGPAVITDLLVSIDAIVTRTGAALQRSSSFFAEGTNGGAATLSTVASTTPAEDTTAAIVIRGTGEGVADNDVVQEGMVVEVLG